jgi:uncharacterized protein YaaW (UPF0174 family)
MPETADHLLTKCNFTEALWQALAPGLNLPQYASLSSLGGPVDWVIRFASAGGTPSKRKRLGVLFFIWWNM